MSTCHRRVAKAMQTATTARGISSLYLISNSPFASPNIYSTDTPIHFLWENSPRHETKHIRNTVKVYSHLPNGLNILDDKWVLARLLGVPHPSYVRKRGVDVEGKSGFAEGEAADAHKINSDNNNNSGEDYSTENVNLATLDSHCFRGADFVTFAKRVGLISNDCGVAQRQQQFEMRSERTTSKTKQMQQQYQFEDLVGAPSSSPFNNEALLPPPPPSPNNLWVIKDAMSNGAGGVWILDQSNVGEFLDTGCSDTATTISTAIKATNKTTFTTSSTKVSPAATTTTTSILHPTHRYIAQQYAWPPTLYHGKKCHVRVYGVITSSGQAFVHKRAFLHVANEEFEYCSGVGEEKEDMSSSSQQPRKFEPSMHITNCCANSHDADKFSGEICADLEKTCSPSTQPSASTSSDAVPLGEYFPSIAASVSALAQRSASFLKGGRANNGFEYLGFDFVLSSVPDPCVNQASSKRIPVAYLLEVNAPPSQDTATGLPHAEALHDEVISDLLRMWVLPKLGIVPRRQLGGWKCVYTHPVEEEGEALSSNEWAVPSKAAILNRIRWAMFEKTAAKEYELMWSGDDANGGESEDHQRHDTKNNNEQISMECESLKGSFDPDAFATFVRSQFPYFCNTMVSASSSFVTEEATRQPLVFLESGGGSQVPRVVTEAVVASMSNRDRSVVGRAYQTEARQVLLSLLTGDNTNDNILVMGSNATSLLKTLAQQYRNNGLLTEEDEIVIASENHLSNVLPWIAAAKSTGASIKWWTTNSLFDAPIDSQGRKEASLSESPMLSDLISSKTKVVAVSHASNILGCVRDIPSICTLVHEITGGGGHVVVDGVAASPHLLSPDAFHGDHVPNWYVVSLHKSFGPHLGCLVGKRSSALELHHRDSTTLLLSDEVVYKHWELGTMNFEACAGAIALKEYVDMIGKEALRRYVLEGEDDGDARRLLHSGKRTSNSNNSLINAARTCIHISESRLLHHLLNYLQKTCFNSVRVIQDVGAMKVDDCTNSSLADSSNAFSNLPIVSFVHASIPSNDIVQHCRNHGLVCRACKFLSTERLWKEMRIQRDEDVVRFSLAHYNTIGDIDRAIEVLELLRLGGDKCNLPRC